jgi:hypothetical protein
MTVSQLRCRCSAVSEAPVSLSDPDLTCLAVKHSELMPCVEDLHVLTGVIAAAKQSELASYGDCTDEPVEERLSASSEIPEIGISAGHRPSVVAPGGSL